MNNVTEKLKAQATEDILGVPVLNEEMFAELIVRECALQCVHNEDMDRIEKHFGVE